MATPSLLSLLLFFLRHPIIKPDLLPTTVPNICPNIGDPLWRGMLFSTQNAPIISEWECVCNQTSWGVARHRSSGISWFTNFESWMKCWSGDVWGMRLENSFQRKLLPHNQHLTFNAVKSTNCKHHFWILPPTYDPAVGAHLSAKIH